MPPERWRKGEILAEHEIANRRVLEEGSQRWSMQLWMSCADEGGWSMIAHILAGFAVGVLVLGCGPRVESKQPEREVSREADADGDGVSDKRDRCPTQRTKH